MHGTESTTLRSLPGNYWRQWTASAISNMGDGISFVAMPLLALSLTADERLLSLVTMMTFVPWILIALPVGVIVDRFERRSLMVGANLVRLVVFVAIALTAISDDLALVILLALLLVIGSCEVVFDSTAQAFLPMLVAPAQLARANGLLFAAEIVAGSIAGLSIGALLFNVSVGLPFTINAASFGIAAILIASITNVRRTNVDAHSPLLDTRLRAGFVWLRGSRLLRSLAFLFTLTNLGLMFGQGIFVKYAIDELGLGTAEYGLLLAVTAMGAASGGLIAHHVIASIGMRASVVVPYVVFGAAQVVIGLAEQAWLVAAAGFLLGGAITIWNVVTVTLRQQVIPADRFGRVNAVYRWLGAVASALGVALGGFVAYSTNLRAPFIIGGGITLVAAVVFARPVLAGLERDDAI